MTKNIRDSFENMTLEELWELFPISLVDHNPKWKEWADMEIGHISVVLERFSPRITHIGSTAIPGIKAKPIVDILVEVPDDCGMPSIRSIMEESGYICMSATENRMSFNKGYTPAGYAEKVFHVHFHRHGDNDEILFRDYLLCHDDMAKEYEALKLELISRYRKNRNAYTDAKSEFVRRVVLLAKMSPQNKRRSMKSLSEQFSIIRKFIKCHAGEGDAVSARQAVEAITPAAENGDEKAQMLLGKYYSWGYHNGCDNRKAIQWFEMAADNGNPEAAMLIMEIYRNDCPDGIDAKQRKAFIKEWHRRWFDILAAKAGNGSAGAAKDLMCQYIDDCPEDIDAGEGLVSARKWYDRWIGLLTAKAAKGDVVDKMNLADILLYAEGVPVLCFWKTEMLFLTEDL